MQTPLRATALILAIFSGGIACAQNPAVNYSALEQRIAALESKNSLEHLDAMLIVDDKNTYPQGHSSDQIFSCDCTECGVPPRDKSWFAGVELYFLSASLSSPTIRLSDDPSGGGMRFILGREAASGFGWRTRLGAHIIDSDVVDYNLGATPVDLELSTARFDFDLFRRFYFKQGSLLFGAGLGSGTIEFEFLENGIYDSMENHGTGVGVFAEGRHAFYESSKSEWAVLTRGRWDYMIGDTTRTDIPDVEFDSTLNTAEGAFGIEFRKRLRRSTFVFQYMMEAQSWQTTQFNDVNFLGTSMQFAFTW